LPWQRRDGGGYPALRPAAGGHRRRVSWHTARMDDPRVRARLARQVRKLRRHGRGVAEGRRGGPGEYRGNRTRPGGAAPLWGQGRNRVRILGAPPGTPPVTNVCVPWPFTSP